jgi:hypothetical protein
MHLGARIGPLVRLLALSGDDGSVRAAGGTTPIGSLADRERAWAGRVGLDRQRVRLRPEDADAWWRLAMGLHALGRHDVASGAFARALRRDLAAIAAAGIPPALVLVTTRLGLALTLDAARAARDLPIVWVCTQPVAFDLVREALGPAGGRAYRLEVEDLAPLLTTVHEPFVGTVAVIEAAAVAGLPGPVRRVRLPRQWVEEGDPQAYDHVLCPTRAFAARWMPAAGAADPRVAVRWPVRTGAGAGGLSASVIAVRAEAMHTDEAAWSPEFSAALLKTLVTEASDLRVVVYARRERQLALRRAWFEVGAEHVDRVRFAFGDGSAEHEADMPSAVIIEPCENSAARALHRHGGLPILVHAPGPGAATVFGLPVFDTPLRMMAAVHALRADPTTCAHASACARAACFFDGEETSLTLDDALRRVFFGEAAEAAAKG